MSNPRADVIRDRLQPSTTQGSRPRRRQGKQQPGGRDKAAREQEAKDKIAQEARDKAAQEELQKKAREQRARPSCKDGLDRPGDCLMWAQKDSRSNVTWHRLRLLQEPAIGRPLQLALA